jgi:hypothetical protein
MGRRKGDTPNTLGQIPLRDLARGEEGEQGMCEVSIKTKIILWCTDGRGFAFAVAFAVAFAFALPARWEIIPLCICSPYNKQQSAVLHLIIVRGPSSKLRLGGI